MFRLLKLFLLIFPFMAAFSQITPELEDRTAIRDSLQELSKREVAADSLKVHSPLISDYTYWRQGDLEKTQIDTTLSLANFYNQNFLEKDHFGKMYFPNIGQTLNPLEFEENPFRIHMLPTGKSFNYLYPEDIKYYDVKTPLTEFIYESGVREGQYLSTLFTHNLTKNWNYSVRYRGLRSIGHYRHNLAANNGFIATVSHKSDNERLNIWTHYAAQKLANEENGGIANLDQFVHDSEFRTTNRQNIEVNLRNAESQFDARRFHLGASYGLIGSKDSVSGSYQSAVLLKNVFTYEKQKYRYEERQPENYFPSAVFEDMFRSNLKSFETLQNTSTVEFKWGKRLLVESGVRFENLKLYSLHPLKEGLVNIPGEISDNLFGAVAKLYFDWNERLMLTGDAEFKSGNIFKSQYHINGLLDIQPIDGYHAKVGVLAESAFPSLNLFYNQSFYKDYNYHNFSFKNINTRKLFGSLEFDRFNTSAEAAVYDIENYVLVDRDFRVKQIDGNVNLFKVKLNNELHYRKFTLATALQYQKVTSYKELLPLPDFIGRATVYYQDHWFNNKAEVQIGVNGYYFTKFKSREFFPVINEFMLQRENEEFGIQNIGGFPILDFFFNIKIQNMRIYFRADHFNSFLGENNFYSAPFTPYKDFKFQIGIKWHLFT